jgi:hypothetical protein
MVYRSRICCEQRGRLEKNELKAESRTVVEEAHIEHSWILESLAIGRHPLIPRDGLASFEDLFDISVEPTFGRWSREFPEWRPSAANLRFDESEDESEERGCKKPERKQPKHLSWDFGETRGVFYIRSQSNVILPVVSR